MLHTQRKAMIYILTKTKVQTIREKEEKNIIGLHSYKYIIPGRFWVARGLMTVVVAHHASRNCAVPKSQLQKMLHIFIEVVSLTRFPG